MVNFLDLLWNTSFSTNTAQTLSTCVPTLHFPNASQHRCWEFVWCAKGSSSTEDLQGFMGREAGWGLLSGDQPEVLVFEKGTRKFLSRALSLPLVTPAGAAGFQLSWSPIKEASCSENPSPAHSRACANFYFCGMHIRLCGLEWRKYACICPGVRAGGTYLNFAEQ